MKKLFYVIAFAMMSVGFAACSKDDAPAAKESGINSKDCEEKIEVANAGASLNITFDAKASWTISSNKSWITFSPKTGEAGENTVNVIVEASEDEAARTAKINLSVKGYDVDLLTQITQQGGGVTVTTLNGWINDKMGEMYLWNEEYRSLNLDPALQVGASDFLMLGLEGVNKIIGDDGQPVNIEDGGYVRASDGTDTDQREYFSNIKQVGGIGFLPSRASTRAKTTLSGLGFYDLRATYFDEAQTQLGVAPLAIYPDSPAAKAGMTRGMYINRINGVTLTPLNYKNLVAQLSISQGGVKVGTAVLSVKDGQLEIDLNGPEFDLVATTYDDSPFYANKIVALDDGTKIGYLTYGQFIADYDDQMMEIFKKFKEEKIDELVIDLRYNGGGYVMSSTLLATLVVGEQYRGEIFTAMEYNAERTAAGKTGEYRIGDSKIPDGEGVYSYISDALNYALGLNRVYVIGTVDTASASEMLVNGLRGLGVDVRLLGQRTHGKNVGMEVMQTSAGGAVYEFSPITFRAYNKNHESEYANGFDPDVLLPRDIEYAIFDFADPNELMFQYVLAWITTGNKPSYGSGVMAKDGLRRSASAQLELNFKKAPTLQNALVDRTNVK